MRLRSYKLKICPVLNARLNSVKIKSCSARKMLPFVLREVCIPQSKHPSFLLVRRSVSVFFFLNSTSRQDTKLKWSSFHFHKVVKLFLCQKKKKKKEKAEHGACLHSLGGTAWVKRSLQSRVKIDLVHKTASRQRGVSKLPLAFIGLPFSCCGGTCRC